VTVVLLYICGSCLYLLHSAMSIFESTEILNTNK
jgi:hypothetical protein